MSNNFLRLTLFIILCGCSIFSNAQQVITGQLLDNNDLPVSYATIRLTNDSSGTKIYKGALSGIDGSFAIRNAKGGRYLLEVTNVGYQPYNKHIVIRDNENIQLGKVILNVDLQNLKEVIIKSRKKLIVQKPDRIVMNIDQSVLAAGNDLFNILSMAPSLQVANGQIRMQGKSNVLIILDGKRLPGSSLENILSAIPGDQIDHIDIITNPSAKYDANASGGVIEIFTKRNKQKGWNVSLGGNGSMGKRSGAAGNGSFRLSTNKFDLVTNGSYSQKTHVEQGYQNRTLYAGAENVGTFNQLVDFKDNDVINKDINASLSYHLNGKNTVAAEFGSTGVTYDGIGNVESYISELNDRSAIISRNKINYAIDLFNYNLKYKSSFDSIGSNLSLLGSYVNYQNNKAQAFEQRKTDETSTETVNTNIRNFTPSNFDIYTLSADLTKIWPKGTQLEAGAKYTYTSNHSSQVTELFENGTWNGNTNNNSDIGYYEKIGAAYINLNATLSKKIVFQAGLRAENTDYKVGKDTRRSYLKLFPNLRVDYKFGDDLSSSFGYAKNINRPGYEKLIPFEMYIDNFTTQRGNAFLKPEYTHSFFMNQVYKDYSLRLSYTITDDAISDLYLYDPNTLRYIATQENFLNSYLLSASLDVPIKLTSWWSTNIGANGFYKELKFPSALNAAVINEKSKWYYTVSSFNSFDLKKQWVAELNFYYYSSFFDGLYDIGNFSNLSAGIKKSFLKNKASIKFDVSDILYDSNMRVSTSEIPVVSDGLIKRDTRRFRVTLKYTISGKHKVKSKALQNSGNEQELNRLGI